MLKKFEMEYYALVNKPVITGCKLSKKDESLEENKTLYMSMMLEILFSLMLETWGDYICPT